MPEHAAAEGSRPFEGAPDRQTALTVVHDAVPGRLRVAVPGIKHAPHQAAQIERSLSREAAVRSVSASATTGRVLVLYDPATAAATVLETVRRIMGEMEAAPAAPPPRTARDTLRPTQNPSRMIGRVLGRCEELVERTGLRKGPEAASDDRRPSDPASAPAAQASGESWHLLSHDEALARVGGSRNGLTRTEAARRLEKYGRNSLRAQEPRSPWEMVREQLTSLPILILAGSAVLSAVTGGLADAVVIGGVIAVNAAIGFYTERQTERTITALLEAVTPSAAVLREGEVIEIPAEEVVVGDVLDLVAGAQVAADARVIETRALTVDESALTGESVPAGKKVYRLCNERAPLGDRVNMVFRGTTVTSGSGRAVVVATGGGTEIAAIQDMIGTVRQPETPMQRQLEHLGNQLVWASSAICVLIFIIGLLRGYGGLAMLKSAISLAVAAVPEGLPATATTALALGVRDMRRHNILVRRLDAVETLGSVRLLAFDKTGTLTRNRMTVVSVRNGGARLTVDGARFTAPDGAEIPPEDAEELRRLSEIVALCSDADLVERDGCLRATGSPTEAALLRLARDLGVDVSALRSANPRKTTWERTEEEALMGTFHADRNGGGLVAVKGSPGHVLARCRTCLRRGREEPLDDDVRADIDAHNEDMAAEALRVLGVAWRPLRGDERPEDADLGDDLVWLGLVGMRDPLRPGMPALMKTFHEAGIDTVMITGDQAATAHAVARELALARDGEIDILEAARLEDLDTEVLAPLARQAQVFARVSPTHKLRIVQALQSGGEVVAMTGDGINDSPALKAADIGIAMGHGGSDVARQAADVVLEDDDIATMAGAVERGRTIYTNIRKTIRYLVATNMSEIEVMLIANALGFGQPLTPMQLLWINLVSDLFPGLALSQDPPEPDVMERGPRDPHEPVLRRQDFSRLTAESGILAGATMVAYGLGAARYGMGPQARTMAFLSLVSSQLLHAASCRSSRPVLWGGRHRPPNRWLRYALLGSFAGQLGIMAVPPLRRLFGIAPLGPFGWAVTAVAGIAPFLLVEGMKTAWPVTDAPLAARGGGRPSRADGHGQADLDDDEDEDEREAGS